MQAAVHSTDALIRRFTHPLVRAQAWAIASPTIFNPALSQWQGNLANDAQSAAWLAEAMPWLEHLQASPRTLHELFPEESRRPLGKSFELLIGHWLSARADVAWVVPSLIVRRSGRTIGEFDFVYADHDGALHSLELTVKFYLRVAPDRGAEGYVGPMVYDFMAQKIARMTSHQMPLGDTEDGQRAIKALLTRKSIAHDADTFFTVNPHAIARGFLFEPFNTAHAPLPPEVNPQYVRAQWLTTQQIHTVPNADRACWRPLNALQWLGPLRASADTCMTLSQCTLYMSTQRHVMVAQMGAADTQGACEELARLMLVTPDARVLSPEFSVTPPK